MLNVIRCIREKDFCMIKNGEWQHDKVGVYYGFDCYFNDVTYVNLIAATVSQEHPEIKRSDMHVHYIDREKSIRHANYITVQVMINAEDVRKNFSHYCIL